MAANFGVPSPCCRDTGIRAAIWRLCCRAVMRKQETGDAIIGPGDVVMHGAFEAHLNRYHARGSEVLCLALPRHAEPSTAVMRMGDPDRVVRLAERDPREAVRFLVAHAEPQHGCCLPPTRNEVGILIYGLFAAQSPAHRCIYTIYASRNTSRCPLQDSRSGWIRYFLSCRALASPTTCRFNPAHSGLPVTRPQSQSIRETLRKAGSENVFDFRNLFQEPQIFREF
jgi:hypothetical protein